MPPTSPMKIVLDKFPNAHAEEVAPKYEFGQSNPYIPGGFVIYSDPPGHSRRKLGEGVDLAKAWADAAREVKLIGKRPTLVLTRSQLEAAEGISDGPVSLETIHNTLDKGIDVCIEEPDGSFTPLDRDENGKLKPRA